MQLRSGKVLIITISALAPATAFAYIDPGTGSVLIQGIIAGVAAVGVTLKLYWHRVTGLFRRKATGDEPSAAATAEPEGDRKK